MYKQEMTVHNYDVALLSMVNELAARYGVKPYDYSAVIYNRKQKPYDIDLRFESAPSDLRKQLAFETVLKSLGISDVSHSPQLTGSEEKIYATVEAALHRAPQRSR